MEEQVLSSATKTKIQTILQDLKFVNEEEAGKFKCSKCSDVAIYHYFATCKHVFCGKCHGQLHNKPCPIQDCKNTAINEISQDMQFEFGINNLNVYCVYKSNGCTDEIKISDILEHKAKCRFSSRNLLPKVWHPPKYNEYYEIFEQKLAELAKQVADIQENQSKGLIKEILHRLDTVESRNNKYEKQLEDAKKTIAQLNQSLAEKLNSTSAKLKKDILKDASTQLTQRFNKQIQDSKNKLSSEIGDKINGEKSNLENLMKITISKDIQEIGSNQEEKIKKLVNGVEEKLSGVLHKKADETKNQIKETVKSIIDNNMTKSTEAISKLRTEKDEELKEIRGYIASIEKKLNDIERNIVVKADPQTDQRKLTQLIDQKIDSFKDYLIGNQLAAFDWKIAGISQIVKDWSNGRTKEILSKEFHSIIYDTILQCKLKNNGNSSFDIELRIDPNCPSPSRTHLYRRTFLIKDQSGVKQTRDLTLYEMPGLKIKTQAPDLMTGFRRAPLSIATSFLAEKSRYVKGDSIVLNVGIEPLDVLYKSVSSANGTLVWTLHNYSQHKKDWLEEVYPRVPSPCFYTSERGYLVHIDMRVGNQLLAFFVCFDRGEHDDNLGLEFSHTASVTLLDKSGGVNEENTTISISRKTIDSTPYSTGFFPMKTIELPKYLINDSVVFKFQVR